jgi:hypothetical protein
MASSNALAVLPDGEGVKAGEAVEIMVLEAEMLGSTQGERFVGGEKAECP